MSKNKTKHEIFLKCVKTELLPVWRTVFINCSLGKFPKGVKYEGNMLKYKKGRHTIYSKFLDIENVEEMTKTVKYVFKKYIEIFSADEVAKQQLEIKNIFHEVLEIDCWKKITSYKMKNDMIKVYTLCIAKFLNLGEILRKNLEKVIQMGITEKSIVSDNIEIQNGYIKKIDNLILTKFGFGVENSTEDLFLQYIEKNVKPIKFVNAN